jgi:hypothetical protein
MSIEASTSVDPFARTCQAAHLLGWVCEHVNQNPSHADADMHFQEAFAISGALRALVIMLHSESNTQDHGEGRHRLFAARGLAYAALNTLYDVHSCIEADNVEAVGGNRGLRLDLQQHALDGFKEVIREVSAFSAEIEQYYEKYGVDGVPVMVLFSLYTVGGTYAWYARENSAPAHLAALADLRRVLDIVGSTRWSVACKSCFAFASSMPSDPRYCLKSLHSLTSISNISEDAGWHRALLPRSLQTVMMSGLARPHQTRPRPSNNHLHTNRPNSLKNRLRILLHLSFPPAINHPHHPPCLVSPLAGASSSSLHSIPTATD